MLDRNNIRPKRPYSFGKNLRLLTQSDFQYLKTNNSKVQSRYLRFYFRASKGGTDTTRIGLSVGRKVGNAVVRNAVKRALREEFRLRVPRNLGVDVLIVVNPLFGKDYRASEKKANLLKSLRRSMTSLFNQVGPKLK